MSELGDQQLEEGEHKLAPTIYYSFEIDSRVKDIKSEYILQLD